MMGPINLVADAWKKLSKVPPPYSFDHFNGGINAKVSTSMEKLLRYKIYGSLRGSNLDSCLMADILLFNFLINKNISTKVIRPVRFDANELSILSYGDE